MKLTWYGTAAVMLESGGTRIVFDPFLGMPYEEEPFRREHLSASYRTASAVLVTHGHFDHIYDIPAVYHDSETPIYATKTPCETLKRRGVGEEKLRLIRPGDHLELGSFRITVYQGRHCRFDSGVIRKTVFKRDTLRHINRLVELLQLNKQYAENGETLFYEIEAEGKRIQLMGSMGMDEDTDYPIGADAMILPFQGTGDPAASVRPIIDKLKPKSIYLDHYDDAFPPMSSLIATDDFVTEMHDRGIATVAMEQGSVYYL